MNNQIIKIKDGSSDSSKKS